MRATGSKLSPSRVLALLRQVQHIDLSINQQSAARSSVVTPEQRDRWLHHMLGALDGLALGPSETAEMRDYFVRAAHFMVTDEEARQIMRELLTLVSGYMVPKLAREIGGEPSKTPLDLQLRQH